MFKWVKKVQRIFKGPQRTGSAHVHIHNDDGFFDDTVALSIEDVISQDSNEGEDIGQLHILSLTEFRTILGDAWEKRADKIFILTEGVLRDRVGKGNMWQRQSEEIFIMLFPTLSEYDAQARAFDIAEEIGFKIIGERFDGGRRPAIRVAGVDPKDALNEDGTFDIATLEQAGREGQSAGEQQKKSTSDTPEENTKPPITNDTPAETSHKSQEQRDWERNAWQEANPDLDWHDYHHPSGEIRSDWQKNPHLKTPAPAPEWQKIGSRPKAKIATDPQWVSMAASKEKEGQPAPAAPPKMGLDYRPCWDRRAQSLALYRPMPVLTYPDGNRLTGTKASIAYKTAAQRLKLDLWIAQQSIKALFPLISAHHETPIFLPFHATSLRDANLETVCQFLKSLTDTVREQYAIIEIKDDGQWTAPALQETITRLQALTLQVAFSLHDQAPIMALGPSVWLGISVDHPVPIDQSLLDLLADHQGPTYQHNIQDRAALHDSLERALTVLGGPALVKNTPKPRPPFALPIERLQGKTKA